MIRKIAVFLLLSAFLLDVSLAQAQQAKKIYRIGYLSLGLGIGSREERFRRGLSELGYIEGRNIVIEWRFAKGRPQVLAELAAELVRLNVDVIVAQATQAVQAAKQTTTTIPILFPTAGDPVAYGLVNSLARPGGNVTGLSNLAPELSGKRLELLKESFPRISRVAVLHDPKLLQSLTETTTVGRFLKLRIQPLKIREATDVETAFSAIKKEQAEALITLPPPGIAVHQSRILELCVKNRLPAMHSSGGWVEAGGLMSYGPDLSDNDRRVAIFVDKILKGAKPADIPVEQPMRFEFIVNLNAAKQIGLTIPPNVLVRAQRVIR